MNQQQLFEIASSFRHAIQTAKKNQDFHNRNDRMNYFPRGCCDDSADLLGYHLYKTYNIMSSQGNGVFRDDNPYNTTNHAWIVLLDHTIIDITADQFTYFAKYPDGIFIGQPNHFYKNLDDIHYYEHYDIEQSERLWHDYQVIRSYLENNG